MADETPPPPPTPAAPAAASRTEPLAIWSLVLSILSWVVCMLFGSIPAIICGHLARSKIRKSSGALKGKELALVALIVAYLEIPMGVFAGIMLVDMIRSERGRLHDLAVKKEEITSDDGKLKITTSGFWVKRSDLNKEAQLQAFGSDGMYVVVITDAKTSVGNMTLPQHHQLTRDHMLQKMENSSATDSISVNIDGHPALQDEVSGTQSGTKLTFLHTTVDEGDSFQQVLAWTLKSRWQKHKDELRDVTNSFHSEK